MDLSIIIVNYNTKDLLQECVESIKSHTKGIKYEVIIVDNASTDGSKSFIKKITSVNIKSVLSAKNRGFSAANNMGFKKATGKHVLFLNSDTKLTSNFLPEIIDWMEGKKRAGVASCALKNRDGSYQGSGGYFPTLPKVFAWMFFLEDIEVLQSIIKPFHPVHSRSPFGKGTAKYGKLREQDWVTGAFFMTNKSILDEVGGFDEDYFMYTEEVDLCYRIKKLGLKVFYNPRWSVIHFGGASSSAEFPILLEFESLKIFYDKHFPKWQSGILRVFLKAGSLLRVFLFTLIGDNKLARIYVKAFQKV